MITPSPSTPRENSARSEARPEARNEVRTDVRTDSRSDARIERREEFREVLSRGRERAREEERSADRAADADRARDSRDDRRVGQSRARTEGAPQTDDVRAQASKDSEETSDSHAEAVESAPKQEAGTAPTSKSRTPVAKEDAQVGAAASEPSNAETAVSVPQVPEVPIAVEAESPASGASDSTQIGFAAAAPGSTRAAANTADAGATSAGTSDEASISSNATVGAAETSTSDSEGGNEELANRPHETRIATTHDARGANTFTIGAPGLVAETNTAQPTAPTPQRLAPAELPQFLQNLAVRVDGSANTALIELEPLDLGRMTVELTLQPEGGVRAEVRAERPDGFAAIEARLTELRASLIERGFASADIQLSLGLAQRDAGRENNASTSRRGRKHAADQLETERVLALSPKSPGSIDLWA